MGTNWLARKLEANGIRYTKYENAFLWIEDMARAQKFADRFANLNWPKILGKYAKLVTPQMQDILQDSQHYGVTAQSELSTDILFKSRRHLSELYPELLSHGTLCFGAKEVMTFLGRKLRGNFDFLAAYRDAALSIASKRTGSRWMTSPISFFGLKL